MNLIKRFSVNFRKTTFHASNANTTIQLQIENTGPRQLLFVNVFVFKQAVNMSANSAHRLMSREPTINHCHSLYQMTIDNIMWLPHDVIILFNMLYLECLYFVKIEKTI